MTEGEGRMCASMCVCMRACILRECPCEEAR